jgi:hypothetical protein
VKPVVIMYLAAIVAANLLVAAFGPGVSIVNAFLFIGLNITARDRLHDAWGTRVRSRMVLLILTGSGISALLNHAALRIAIASAVAFAVSEGLDALIYHLSRRSPWMTRVTRSNAVSAAADSLVFPALAFGGFLPWITLGQFVAKVFGGTLWAFVLRPRSAAVVIALLCALPLRAQIVSVDAGVITNVAGTDPVAEVFAATPPVYGVRAFGIASLRRGSDKLSYQTQFSLSLVASRTGMVAVTGGALFLPFRDYEPWGILGGQATLFIPGTNLSVIGVASYAPADDWRGTYLLKLSATGLFIR